MVLGWSSGRVQAQGSGVPTWQWLQSGGSQALPNGDTGRQLAVDAQGNTYVAGITQTPAQFGGLTLVADPLAPTTVTMMSFVAKYNANGALQWIQGTAGRVYDVALDRTGNCYALVSGPKFGTTALPQPEPSVSLIKCDAGGQVEWAERVITIPDSTRAGVTNAMLAIDRQGQFYVGARHYGPLTIGTTAFTSANGLIMVARFDAARTMQWAVSTGTGRDRYYQQELRGLEVDAFGRTSLAITFTDTLSLGPNTLYPPMPLPNASGLASALFRLGPTGQLLWGQHVGTSNGSIDVGGLAVDTAGASYVSGAFAGRAHFGSVTLDSDSANTLSGWNADAYLVKVDAGGQQQWIRRLANVPPLAGAGTGEFVVGQAVALDRQGEPYQLGLFAGGINFGTQHLQSDITHNSSAFLVHYTSAGQPVWALPMTAPNEQAIWAALAVGANGECYLTGSFYDVLQLGPLQAVSRGVRSAFVAKTGGVDVPFLRGRVYYDANANAQRDPGESPIFKPVVVEVQPGPIYLTTLASRFTTHLLPGTYTLNVPNPPRYYSLTTPNRSVVFTAPGQVDTTALLGLYAPEVHDLRVVLTLIPAIVPGREAHYVVTCTNMGTVSEAGTLTLALDPVLQYLYSQPLLSAPVAQTMTWNVGPLVAGQEAVFNVFFRPAASLSAGTIVTSTASVTLAAGGVDAEPADNSDTSSVAARASYDPNDKQVAQPIISPQFVQGGQWLTYTVRFQNTGNASAQRVQIVDTLDARLQRGTFEVVATSHNVLWDLRGAGIATFTFANINLPDSATNEPASHGFVTYRVRVQPTLAIGDSVLNRAHIYFDFNPGIATNTAVSRVMMTTGLPESVMLPVTLYPNPAQHEARFTLRAPSSGLLHLRVFNALGQLVWQQERLTDGGIVTGLLPVQQWVPGLYYVQAQSGKYMRTQSLLVQP
jgi:uncharacterized repeat protein (TIGR01451 family)